MQDPLLAPRDASTDHAASGGVEAELRASIFGVTARTVVFRMVRDELCVGLVREGDARVVPAVAPNADGGERTLVEAARVAATRVAPARDIVRVVHAGVRVDPNDRSERGAPANLSVISWGISRPITSNAGTAESLEAEANFVPLATLANLSPATRVVLACAFDAFLDATLADALTRRLLPRHLLFRKTDGFGGRSPFESVIGEPAATGDAETPIFVGLLPDPFPLSSLRELYERLLGASLDRGNFRRQFHEIIALGPIKALPIFERGVPHRAGQLFTFDRLAWSRFASA